MSALAAAMAVQGAGGIGSTISDVQSATTNANWLQAQGRDIDENTAYQLRQHRRQARLIKGEATARGAASGVDISSGSALFAELDRARQAALEAADIARSGKYAADTKRFEARLTRRSIPGMIFGGLTGTSGSILNTYMAGKG